jgi:secreted trypsin-like serine protease
VRKAVLAAALSAGMMLSGALLGAARAGAITFGHVDGHRHPNVGALVKLNGKGKKGWFCSGTLIAPTVVLTAGHCTDFLNPRKPLWVTFEPEFDRDGIFYGGHAVTDPNYRPNTLANDVGLVLLDNAPAGIEPAPLIGRGVLDRMKRLGTLKGTDVTNVGYGATVRFTHHPPEILYDGIRRYSRSPVKGLTKDHLLLQENHSATGEGGTCFGDSGGPHFLGDSDAVASVTSWGDAICRSLDQTQRVDAPGVRSFLRRYVDLG